MEWIKFQSSLYPIVQSIEKLEILCLMLHRARLEKTLKTIYLNNILVVDLVPKEAEWSKNKNKIDLSVA